MPHRFEIRPAKRPDAAPIAHMSRELIEQGLPGWAWTPARVARALADRETLGIVADRGGELAGFAVMAFGCDQAFLQLLAVGPRHRRRGLGRRLIVWLEECALVAGTPFVYLEVRAGNEAAQAFYRRLGYRVVGRLPGYYAGREAALRMGRDLWADASASA
ncbi:MAG: GNAT family N-acetyltransferase [Gammaproteobacteria bacterium]|nr:GNAT family N-acetyltransferase [Gammaproteobacteria bacterium]